MSADEPPRRGVFESLRRLCDTGLALVQNRVELFAVEIQEEKERLVRLLVLAAAAVFLANTAVIVLTLTVVFIAGEDARVPVLIGLSVAYLLAATGAFLLLRKHLRSAPPPFDTTVSELKKDREWLNSPK
jgi:uncharacterized membrane protein YqjE